MKIITFVVTVIAFSVLIFNNVLQFSQVMKNLTMLLGYGMVVLGFVLYIYFNQEHFKMLFK